MTITGSRNRRKLKVSTDKHMIVTVHAEKRMMKRMGTSKNKLIKIASKAWHSKNPLPPLDRIAERTTHGWGRVGREFSGNLFVFKEEKNDIVLVTVINPRQPFEADAAAHI